MPEGSTLAGSRVAVTGASAGPGRAIALRFAAAGCKVALIARDAERLRDLRCEIRWLVETLVRLFAARKA